MNGEPFFIHVSFLQPVRELFFAFLLLCHSELARRICKRKVCVSRFFTNVQNDKMIVLTSSRTAFPIFPYAVPKSSSS